MANDPVLKRRRAPKKGTGTDSLAIVRGLQTAANKQIAARKKEGLSAPDLNGVNTPLQVPEGSVPRTCTTQSAAPLTTNPEAEIDKLNPLDIAQLLQVFQLLNRWDCELAAKSVHAA